MPSTSKKRSIAKILVFVLLAIGVPAGIWFFDSPKKVDKSVNCQTIKTMSAYLKQQGFDEKSFEFISDKSNYDQSDEVNSNGRAAFVADPVLTTQQLSSLLSSTDGRASHASSIVKKRLNGREVTWIGVKFLVPIEIEGNLGLDKGKVVNFGTRKSAKGDVVWFPIDSKCEIVKDLVIRAGCGNPGKSVQPKKPAIPQNPSCDKGLVKNRNHICVKPKSNNPKDYRYPTKKPVVPKVTSPPDKTPPPVVKTQTGGNGVIDSATKSPGSESGVTAPSASPAPKQPSPTPTNEGGSNNGEVGGF